MSTTLISLIVGNIFAFGLALFTYFTTRKKVSAETRKENTSSDILILQQNAEYVKRLEERIDALSDKIDEISKINDALKVQIDTLIRANNELQSEKVILAVTNGEQVKRIATLETKVSELEKELKRFHDIEQNLKDVDVHAKVDSMVAEIKSEIIK